MIPQFMQNVGFNLFSENAYEFISFFTKINVIIIIIIVHLYLFIFIKDIAHCLRRFKECGKACFHITVCVTAVAGACKNSVNSLF